ncbi:MAG TPA: winged helix-turn-helix transcriptional regulator [Symbiobacteriaceae bacterium]|nr:winged helix-turn-helix transcriptional regulator [Symbiobacteriaceae bacterium]
MWHKLGEYLGPTPFLHELRILSFLKEKPGTPQAELARVVGLAPAMVNNYLRRLVAEGLIERVPKNGRGLEYRLTPEGERRRSYHVISCLAELNGLFQSVALDLRHRIEQLCGTDPSRVVVYGAGETGQMACLVLRSIGNVSVLAVVDDDPAKVGQKVGGHLVLPPEAIHGLKPDQVLVASWRHAGEMAGKLTPLVQGTGIRVLTLTP